MSLVMKTFEVGGIVYGYDEIEVLRRQLIELRDAALEKTDFETSIKLTHAIGVIHEMNNFIRDLK